MMQGGKRKPSFKMVSNMVIQLLHSIKYSVEVPFSNMAQQQVEIQKTNASKKVLWNLIKNNHGGPGKAKSPKFSVVHFLHIIRYTKLMF